MSTSTIELPASGVVIVPLDRYHDMLSAHRKQIDELNAQIEVKTAGVDAAVHALETAATKARSDDQKINEAKNEIGRLTVDHLSWMNVARATFDGLLRARPAPRYEYRRGVDRNNIIASIFSPSGVKVCHVDLQSGAYVVNWTGKDGKLSDKAFPATEIGKAVAFVRFLVAGDVRRNAKAEENRVLKKERSTKKPTPREASRLKKRSS